jgi:lipopolysaccharide export system protein LptC
MSYGFTVRAATAAEAKQKVAAELDKVVASQSVHARDRAQAQAAADAFVDLLAQDDTMDVEVRINGSVGWRTPLATGGEAALPLTAAAVSVSAYQLPREPAQG